MSVNLLHFHELKLNSSGRRSRSNVSKHRRKSGVQRWRCSRAFIESFLNKRSASEPFWDFIWWNAALCLLVPFFLWGFLFNPTVSTSDPLLCLSHLCLWCAKIFMRPLMLCRPVGPIEVSEQVDRFADSYRCAVPALEVRDEAKKRLQRQQWFFSYRMMTAAVQGSWPCEATYKQEIGFSLILHSILICVHLCSCRLVF